MLLLEDNPQFETRYLVSPRKEQCLLLTWDVYGLETEVTHRCMSRFWDTLIAGLRPGHHVSRFQRGLCSVIERRQPSGQPSGTGQQWKSLQNSPRLAELHHVCESRLMANTLCKLFDKRPTRTVWRTSHSHHVATVPSTKPGGCLIHTTCPAWSTVAIVAVPELCSFCRRAAYPARTGGENTPARAC